MSNCPLKRRKVDNPPNDNLIRRFKKDKELKELFYKTDEAGRMALNALSGMIPDDQRIYKDLLERN